MYAVPRLRTPRRSISGGIDRGSRDRPASGREIPSALNGVNAIYALVLWLILGTLAWALSYPLDSLLSPI